MVSYTSSSAGPDQSCACSCQKLVARVKSLEDTVAQLLQRQQSAGTPKTTRGVPATLTTSAQKYEHVGKLGKSGHLFGEFRVRLGLGEGEITCPLKKIVHWPSPGPARTVGKFNLYVFNVFSVNMIYLSFVNNV